MSRSYSKVSALKKVARQALQTHPSYTPNLFQKLVDEILLLSSTQRENLRKLLTFDGVDEIFDYVDALEATSEKEMAQQAHHLRAQQRIAREGTVEAGENTHRIAADTQTMVQDILGDEHGELMNMLSSMIKENALLMEAENNRDAYLSLVEQDRKTWFAAHFHEFRTWQKQLSQTGMIEVPSHEAILEVLRRTTGPVLLYGSPGTGKTEMELLVGREEHRRNIKAIVRAYEQDGFTVMDDEELRAKFHQENPNMAPEEVEPRYRDYLQVLSDKKIISSNVCLEPIVISGHGGLSVSKLDTKTRLIVSKPSAAEILKEYRDIISSIDNTEERVLVASFFAQQVGQTETVDMLGELLRAAKYGQVLIFDEINAVPHQVLILINHIITRKSGDVIHPNAGTIPSFTLHENFRFRATANIGSQFSRNELDTPLYSRFEEAREVSYPIQPTEVTRIPLPQDIQTRVMTGSISMCEAEKQAMSRWSDEERATYRHGGSFIDAESGNTVQFPGVEKEELFHILCTLAIPRGTSGTLPSSIFYDLRKLATVAHGLQVTYEGDLLPQFKAFHGDAVKILQEGKGVPTLRHLSKVVEKWRDHKYQLPLDYYIWVYCIQHTPEKKEREYLKHIYTTIGNFCTDAVYENIHNCIIEKAMQRLKPPSCAVFSRDDIVESIFGPAPGVASVSAPENNKLIEQVDGVINGVEELLFNLSNDQDLIEFCSIQDGDSVDVIKEKQQFSNSSPAS